MRYVLRVLVVLFLGCGPASAEVVGVTIASRTVIANGQPFGDSGAYERLTGRILFALDPAHPRNAVIVDLDLAPRGTDGRVYFSADLLVLQPVERSRGNGALLFDIANRGRALLLSMFNGAPSTNTPTAPADVGDGYLLREGYTLVWVGWQMDVAAPQLSIDAPRAHLDTPDTVRATFVVDAAMRETTVRDLPPYAPADRAQPDAMLSVRDRFWEAPTPVSRDRWRFVASRSGRPTLQFDDGFEPGRVYEIAYRSAETSVAGVGFAALRDAAAAFRYRDDLPVQGRTAYAFGVSQSGRFLRQFLAEGFNADERDRRAFDVVWPHVAGAALGSFNERFAKPGYSSYPATRFPFTDAEQTSSDGRRGGIVAGYGTELLPNLIYTNSSVEYWGQGRAAALTHVTIDGTADVALPDHVRSYLIAGSQHVPATFPPRTGAGQQLVNPIAHAPVMRALLRAAHRWSVEGVPPPPSRIPRLADGTLVPVAQMALPEMPGVPADPRMTEGPAATTGGKVSPLPFLVPHVDADGNETAGIRVPEVSVPLATTTGWNFRSPSVGRPDDLYPLLGSYIPFARTAQEREAGDPRRPIAERYRSRDDYLQRIEAAAAALVTDGYLLAEDLPAIRERAAVHWDFAMRDPPPAK